MNMIYDHCGEHLHNVEGHAGCRLPRSATRAAAVLANWALCFSTAVFTQILTTFSERFFGGALCLCTVYVLNSSHSKQLSRPCTRY